METEIINGTDVAKEGQGEAYAVVVPELVRELRDLNFREVSEHNNGVVNVLDRLYSDYVSFKLYWAVTDHVIACSRRVEGEAGYPPP